MATFTYINVLTDIDASGGMVDCLHIQKQINRAYYLKNEENNQREDLKLTTQLTPLH
jgi:hypothetical protein